MFPLELSGLKLLYLPVQELLDMLTTMGLGNGMEINDEGPKEGKAKRASRGRSLAFNYGNVERQTIPPGNRTAVERVNSRIDVSFGFELHTIRGLQKMQIRCGLALVVMLAMAVGRIEANQPDKMRSLVQSA